MTSSISPGRTTARLRFLVAARGDRLHLAQNSLGLIAGKIASMALGFLFWVVAARVASARDVGIAAGSVSAMMLGTQLALFGIGAAFTVRLPRDEDQPRALLDTSITMVAASAALVAMGMLIIAGLLLKQLGQVALSPAYAALFVAMTVFGTVGILLDQVSVALGRGPQVLSRNTISGLVSLVPLVALPLLVHGVTAMQLFSLWVAGGLATCAYGAWQLGRAVDQYRYRPALRTALALDLIKVGLPNHLLTLSDRVPGLILPVIVTEALSPTANAHWYVIWMMAWIVYIAPNSFGLALFAEGARRPGAMNEVVRRSVRLAVLVGTAGAGAVAIAGEPALHLLGRGYANAGFLPLLVLLLAVVPLTYVQAYYAACRARGLLREAVTMGIVTAAVATALTAAAGAGAGLIGMAIAWVSVQTVAGTWAAFRLNRLTAVAIGMIPDAREIERTNAVATPVVAAAFTDAGVPPMVASGTETALPPLTTARRYRTAAVGRRWRPALNIESLDIAGLAAVALAVVIWLLSARHLDTTRIGDLGLVTLLPVPLLVVPAILTVSFVVQLWRRHASPPWLLTLHVVALILVLYGIFAMVEVVPHNQVAYRHAGIIQTLLQTHHIDGTIDAYFDWPGFFALGALATKATGLAKPLDLAPWAAVLNNLLYFAPLALIMRAFSKDRRLRWLALWIFYLANWVDQDYLSPQGFAYFLFLTVLALVLSYFRPAPVPHWLIRQHRIPTLFRRAATWLAKAPVETSLPDDVLARRRPAVLVLTVLLLAGLVPTHQLTPFAVILALTALLVVNQCSSRRLPFIAILLTVTWLLVATVPYLQGHLGTLAHGVANVSASTNANLGNRVSGPRGHLIIVDVRIAITGVLLLLAAGGFLRRWRRGHRDTAAAVLVLAPYTLFLLQPYGGEVLLRAYYFSLPFTAFLAAAILVPAFKSQRLGRIAAGAVAAVACLSLLTAFGFARYGNERMLAFTPAEVAGIDHLYQVAPQGSLIVAGSSNTAWRSTGYATYHYETLTQFWTPGLSPSQVLQVVANRMKQVGATTSYLLFTRSQEEAINLLGTLPTGSIADAEMAASASPNFRLLWSNSDARIYVLRPNAAR